MPIALTWNVTVQPNPNVPASAGASQFVDLYLDPATWDIVWRPDKTTGLVDLVTIAGLPAIAQAIQVELQLIQGEWFDAPDDGVPWVPTPASGMAGVTPILGQKTSSTAYAIAQIRAAILSVTDPDGESYVTSITTLSAQIVDRQLVASFTAVAGDLGTITGTTGSTT